jgi:hypothetical protein
LLSGKPQVSAIDGAKVCRVLRQVLSAMRIRNLADAIPVVRIGGQFWSGHDTGLEPEADETAGIHPARATLASGLE